MLRFTCQNCNKKLKAPTEKVGAFATCPRCKSKFNIPNPDVDPSSPTCLKSTSPEVSQQYRREFDFWAPNVESFETQSTAASHQPEVQEHRLVSRKAQVKPVTYELAEIKQAIKELRAEKKSLALEKRLVMQEQREIRQHYTQTVRNRGSKFIGGGSIGRTIRVFQTVHRDGVRRQLADALAPLERKRTRIEEEMLVIDSQILKLERMKL